MSDKLLLTNPRIITLACRVSCLSSLSIASEFSADKHATLLDMVRKKKIPITRQPMRILHQHYPQSRGLVGIAHPPPVTPLLPWMKSLLPSAGKTVVLLDHIEDPHNLGAIIRSAEGFHIDMLLLPRQRSAPLSDTVARTSAGAVFTMRYDFIGSSMQLLKQFRKKGFWIYAADVEGVLAHSCDLTGNILLIIGNEGRGISSTVKKFCDELVAIPMQGAVGSLNTSVAAGILFYERLRQLKL